MSLVCKQWSVLEKDQAAWPNNLALSGIQLDSTPILNRLRGKRFDVLSVCILFPSDPTYIAARLASILDRVKAKRLKLEMNVYGAYTALSEAKSASHIESLEVARPAFFHDPVIPQAFRSLPSLSQFSQTGGISATGLVLFRGVRPCLIHCLCRVRWSDYSCCLNPHHSENHLQD